MEVFFHFFFLSCWFANLILMFLCVFSLIRLACDESLDLLGSNPNIEREQRAKQQYFTYWLLRGLQG
jgi:hypothetical protein